MDDQTQITVVIALTGVMTIAVLVGALFGWRVFAASRLFDKIVAGAFALVLTIGPMPWFYVLFMEMTR